MSNKEQNDYSCNHLRFHFLQMEHPHHLLKSLSSFNRGLLWCWTKNKMTILPTVFVFIFFIWNILIIFWSSYHHSTEVFFDVEQRTKWLFFRPSSFSFSSYGTFSSSSEVLIIIQQRSSLMLNKEQNDYSSDHLRFHFLQIEHSHHLLSSYLRTIKNKSVFANILFAFFRN